jgi:hypothetical protein
MNNDKCLNELIKGVNVGILAIEHVEDKIEDYELKNIVLSQKQSYKDLKSKIINHYSCNHEEGTQELMMEMMIELKTLMKDDKKIARMLIEGSNQAIMSMTHLLNEEEHVEETLKNFAKEFEYISKKYIEYLKTFI